MQRNITRRNFLRLGNTPTGAASSSEAAITTNPDHYTPTNEFFHQQVRHVPQIDPTYWAFSLGGLVKKLLLLPYRDFLALPAVELPVTLTCIGSTASQPLAGHARWRGIALQTLLDEVEPAAHASYVQCYSADGYTTFIERSRLSEAILAYEMNGEPLPAQHGFPVRLIVPGLSGYKMPKWLQRMQLTDTPVNGFWEERGWSASGEAQTLAAVLSPRHRETVNSNYIIFSGIAYAGSRAITQVEISIDDAPWMPVPVQPAARYSWTPWQIAWTPPAPGDYLVKVRAADDSPTTPSGSDGGTPGSSPVQSIVIRVSS